MSQVGCTEKRTVPCQGVSARNARSASVQEEMLDRPGLELSLLFTSVKVVKTESLWNSSRKTNKQTKIGPAWKETIFS